MVCHIDCQTPAMSRGVLSRWPSLVGGINVYHRRIHWYALMFVPKQRNGKQPRSTNTKTRIPTDCTLHAHICVCTNCLYVCIYIYINVQYYTHIEETNVIIDIWTHQPQRGGWTSPASTRTQMFGRFSRVSSSFVRRCTSFHLPQMQKRSAPKQI